MRVISSGLLAVSALSHQLHTLASPTNAPPAQEPFGFVDDTALTIHKGRDPKVPVALYVMSRCPDARTCETVFEDVLHTSGVSDKIDLSLQIVAHLNNSDPLGVTCKHGSLECIGNAHELCLVKHLDPAQWYAVLACLNFESPFPGKIGDVELTRRCVEATKLDWWGSGVGQCIQGKKAKKDDGQKAKKTNHLGKEARGLLLENVARTEQTSVTKSCTIVIDSTAGRGSTNRTCVIDGGAWIGCDDGHSASDFVRVIEEEWKRLQRK